MNIKELRRAKGIKQADLAKKVGISNSLLSRYEKGDMKPSAERLEAIAKALGVDAEELQAEYSLQFDRDDFLADENIVVSYALDNHSIHTSSSDEPPVIKRLRHYSKVYGLRQQVMMYAEGKCELCGKPAPFKDKEGNPYLEIHHIVPAKDGGESVPSNVVVLCPNCNRRIAVAPTPEDKEELSEIVSQHTWGNYLELVELIKNKDS